MRHEGIECRVSLPQWDVAHASVVPDRKQRVLQRVVRAHTTAATGKVFHNDQERQYSSPQLSWMTRQALTARINYLWDTGHREYQHRNNILNIRPDSPPPNNPPPNDQQSPPPKYPHDLQDPFYWSIHIPGTIK